MVLDFDLVGRKTMGLASFALVLLQHCQELERPWRNDLHINRAVRMFLGQH
jgi:hypothetical protein